MADGFVCYTRRVSDRHAPPDREKHDHAAEAAADKARALRASKKDVGPDPVSGAGVCLLGIFLMGVGGASDSHYLFDFAVGVAVLGAAGFVGMVALSALKRKELRDPHRSSPGG